MRAVIVGIAATLALSASALAGEEMMAGYFGNTVIAKSSAGELHVRYKPDHTFTGKAKGPTGNYDVSGTWELNAQGTLCRKYTTNGSGQDLPPGTPNPYCAPVQSHKVGDSWTVTDNLGRSAQVQLVEGRK